MAINSTPYISKFNKNGHFLLYNRYTIYYTSNISFLLEIQIIYKTVELVLLRKKQYKDFKKFYE